MHPHAHVCACARPSVMQLAAFGSKRRVRRKRTLVPAPPKGECRLMCTLRCSPCMCAHMRPCVVVCVFLWTRRRAPTQRRAGAARSYSAGLRLMRRRARAQPSWTSWVWAWCWTRATLRCVMAMASGGSGPIASLPACICAACHPRRACICVHVCVCVCVCLSVQVLAELVHARAPQRSLCNSMGACLFACVCLACRCACAPLPPPCSTHPTQTAACLFACVAACARARVHALRCVQKRLHALLP